MAYTAVLIDGPASGQSFRIEQLFGKIEIPVAGDMHSQGALEGLATYERQPTVTPVKEGGTVFYKPVKP
ncbi:hypothetical protein N22_003 [Idiomarinaceae phage 1N2-2]|uniref:hypothetical protein n=1 Tax=Idiomarinaceae phage 1N2-2 TaxID=1536592 RepID=UPI0004F910BF|nr:hypothetical protein N22_003 [Idiomarinaceae phage 1N2-2]AIM40705.1 hypothetical protein N22_003 [Idiomarinaceae phage 1N2-2]